MISVQHVKIITVREERIMNYNIYFSPTGSTEKVTTFVAEQFSKYQKVDLSKKQDFYQFEFTKEDFCIIGVPCFGGRVPMLAVERIREMRGNQTPAVLIVTFGNRAYDDALLELKETLELSGFLCVAAMAVVCEHSIMHQYGKGRPHCKDFEEIKSFVDIVKERCKDEMISIKVPGNAPYKEYHGIPLKPTASFKKCISCGACALLCPAQAIPIDNPSHTDHQHCISCMRCIQVCPQHARKNNPVLLMASVQKLKKACQTEKKNEFY